MGVYSCVHPAEILSERVSSMHVTREGGGDSNLLSRDLAGDPY
jgi:hypothetical protein